MWLADAWREILGSSWCFLGFLKYDLADFAIWLLTDSNRRIWLFSFILIAGGLKCRWDCKIVSLSLWTTISKHGTSRFNQWTVAPSIEDWSSFIWRTSPWRAQCHLWNFRLVFELFSSYIWWSTYVNGFNLYVYMHCRLLAGSMQREHIVWIPRWTSWNNEGQVCSVDPWVYLSLQKPGNFYLSAGIHPVYAIVGLLGRSDLLHLACLNW